MSEEIIQPTKLSECFKHLDGIMSDAEDSEWFMNEDEEKAIDQTHHGLGTWMRSNWGLTSKDSELFEYFKKLGLKRGDDISTVILTSYHRHLNKKELKLSEQIKHYIEFWKNNTEDVE